jgi:hypothetical protein
MLCIPDLYQALARADCEVGTPLNPAHTGDSIVLQLTELSNSARLGVPHVDGVSQTDTQDVAAAPVNQVQVEIVLQIWSIEDLERDLVDVAGLLSRCFKNALAFISNGRGTVEFRAGIQVGRMGASGGLRWSGVARSWPGRTVVEEVLVWS